MFIKAVLRYSIICLALARLLSAASVDNSGVDPDRLLKLAVQRVKENTVALSRLTCEEHTSRAYYVAPSPKAAKESAEKLAESKDSAASLPPLLTLTLDGKNLLWSDRIRVELSLFNGRDVFSWPGGASFDSDLDNLVTNGATLSGVLGPFDLSLLANDTDPGLFHFERTLTALGVTLAEYSYEIAVAKSHLVIPYPSGKQIVVPYRGFFLIDTSTGDLRRHCIELEQFPKGTELSRAAIATDYASHPITGLAAFAPVASSMRLLFERGQLSVNNMSYVNCRQFQSESTLSFGSVKQDAPSDKPSRIAEQLPDLPKDRTLKVSLDSPIDSDTAAAGDPIQAHVTNSVKDKSGHVVIPAGAVLYGRILRIVQYAPPYNSFDLV